MHSAVIFEALGSLFEKEKIFHHYLFFVVVVFSLKPLRLQTKTFENWKQNKIENSCLCIGLYVDVLYATYSLVIRRPQAALTVRSLELVIFEGLLQFHWEKKKTLCCVDPSNNA